MKKLKNIVRSGVLALSFATLACGGGGNYAKSVYGTTGGYSFKNVHAKPANLMVATKIERPLFIVLDPAKAKNVWQLGTSPCATGAAGCEHFNLMDVHEFVRRDLKAALANYFAKVEVIDAGQPLPSTPHIVADVKIDDIKIHDLVRGAMTYSIIQMTWGFALRPSDKTEYTYTFAGTSESGDSYPTFEEGCGQLVENAIPMMLKKWTESGGIEALRSPAK